MKNIKKFTEFLTEAREFESPREEALKNGCCGCLAKDDFTHSFTDEDGEILTCNKCGCIHTDDYYEYKKNATDKKSGGASTWVTNQEKEQAQKEKELVVTETLNENKIIDNVLVELQSQRETLNRMFEFMKNGFIELRDRISKVEDILKRNDLK
jgi:hypothetical protein